VKIFSSKQLRLKRNFAIMIILDRWSREYNLIKMCILINHGEFYLKVLYLREEMDSKARQELSLDILSIDVRHMVQFTLKHLNLRKERII